MGVLLGRKGGGSGGGGGGGIPNPITDTVTISPDTDEAALVINTHPGSVQTTLPFQVYDENGDLAMDIDSQGRLDVRSYNVQDPPNTGSGPIVAVAPGRITINDDGSNEPLAIKDTSDSSRTYFSVKRGGAGNIVQIDTAANQSAATIIAGSGQTAALIDAWDNPFNVRLFAVLAGGAVLTGANAAPADGDLNPGECALWFDPTNGAAKLKIKGKSADGTVVAGEVALA